MWVRCYHGIESIGAHAGVNPVQQTHFHQQI